MQTIGLPPSGAPPPVLTLVEFERPTDHLIETRSGGTVVVSFPIRRARLTISGLQLQGIRELCVNGLWFWAASAIATETRAESRRSDE